MIYKIIAECYSNMDEPQTTFEIQNPEICPCCNIAWQPRVINAVYTRYYDDLRCDDLQCDEYRFTIDVVWFCPSCKRPSISRYFANSITHANLDSSFPQFAKTPDFYTGIEKLSPSFVKIYEEALNAECQGLHEVAGVGYRKALEFLVKDYAISIAPNEKEVIEETSLAKCVSKYISNPKIASIVERTVWLGNDQTHYKIKHVGKGIEDLKLLLNLSVSYITMELQAEEAMKITKK